MTLLKHWLIVLAAVLLLSGCEERRPLSREEVFPSSQASSETPKAEESSSSGEETEPLTEPEDAASPLSQFHGTTGS